MHEKGGIMTYRVYVLADLTDGNIDRLIRLLQRQKGVVLVDHLERPPDLLIALGAPNRETLAKLTVRVMASIEDMVEDIEVKPACGVTRTRCQETSNENQRFASVC